MMNFVHYFAGFEKKQLPNFVQLDYAFLKKFK